MLKKYSFIFIGVFTLLLLVSTISYVNYQNASAQNYTGSNLNSTIPKVNGGIKIISPEKESFVPINSNSSFIIKGISKDNATADCKVSIIINGIKPYQPVQPMNGKEDYSTWQYNLSKNYTNFVLGSNKITAKSYCLPTQQSSYYSANVTGMNFSPEQLQSYNSTNMTTTNSTTSNLTSSLVAGPHPVALEIQALKNSSSQMAIPPFVPVDNTISQALQGVTPVASDTNSQSSSKDSKDTNSQSSSKDSKDTNSQSSSKDNTPSKKEDKPVPQITTFKYIGTPSKDTKKDTTSTKKEDKPVPQITTFKYIGTPSKDTKKDTTSTKKEDKPAKVDKDTTDTTTNTNTPFSADPVKEDKPIAKHVKHVNPIFNDDKPVAKVGKHVAKDTTDTTTNTPASKDTKKPIDNNNNQDSVNERTATNNLMDGIMNQVKHNLALSGVY
jgi:hypothetical protein